MYRTKHFLLVSLLTGFFGGLINFIFLALLLYFVQEIFSLTYLIPYLFPFVYLIYANLRLRDRYNEGMLSFGQSFRLSMLTGIFAAAVLSVMVYYIFTHVLNGIIQYRALALEADLISMQAEKSLGEIRNIKSWIRQMISPINLALYYFILNLLLTPIQAFFIAIFVWRKKRYIDV